MLFEEQLVLIRGAGDLATGVAVRLHRVGFPLVMLELPGPLVVRRTVAFAEAVRSGQAVVEDVTAYLVGDAAEAK
ncbi:MAG: selenium-dependent molybdenum cofactor biosynthesis protein YqeB, partial [Ardenticatenaceae bacterium]